MTNLSTLDLQNLRHLIGGHETTHCKMQAYAQSASDPQVQQFFQKAAQSASLSLIHIYAHFLIEKRVEGRETRTGIFRLDTEESIQELARILGGARITEHTVESAREMKELAQVHKNASVKS